MSKLNFEKKVCDFSDPPSHFRTMSQIWEFFFFEGFPKQSGFFWGSGEANSQTNSPQEADDRPKSLQSVNSVALMVCWQYGLPIIWSAGYMICRLCLQTVWSAGYMICRLCLQTVWSVACMVCRLYDLRTVWFTECIGYSMNGLHTVWSSERMGCQL